MSSKVTRKIAVFSAIAALLMTAWSLVGPVIDSSVAPPATSTMPAQGPGGDIDICWIFPRVCIA